MVVYEQMFFFLDCNFWLNLKKIHRRRTDSQNSQNWVSSLQDERCYLHALLNYFPPISPAVITLITAITSDFEHTIALKPRRSA